MPRRVLLGAVLAAVLLALLPCASTAETIDPAPTRVLNTSYAVNGVARSPANGNLYVSGTDGSIHVYAGNASGSDAPLTTFSLGCTPWQITFNPPRFRDAGGLHGDGLRAGAGRRRCDSRLDRSLAGAIGGLHR